MSYAHIMVENQELLVDLIKETRVEPTEELDRIHLLTDGSYVYEENQLDWDDDTGKTKMFQTLYLSNLANFSSFQATPKWSDDDYDEETELYYDELAEMEDWK